MTHLFLENDEILLFRNRVKDANVNIYLSLKECRMDTD